MADFIVEPAVRGARDAMLFGLVVTAVFLGARRRRPMRRVRGGAPNVAARRQWLVSAMRSHCAFTRFAVRASAHEAFRCFKRCYEMLKTPLRAMPLQLVLIKMGLVVPASARASRSGICATPSYAKLTSAPRFRLDPKHAPL